MDEKGRIKGKINIIDLILIIAAVLVAAFLAVRYLGPYPKTVENTPLTVTFYGEETDEFAANAVKAGDRIYDPSSKNELGEVISVEVGECVSYNTDSDGMVVKTKTPGYSSIMITASLEAEETDFGFELNKAKYAIGHTTNLLCGNSTLKVRIYDIQAAK